ncbi:PepSY domain-containing protein [Sphingomonas sp. RP10(2022)]|uniref:PepSY domain-containing protein n=1 Tax=Sphingomonas liriopis TaxID=2949094 RepID=A0A9X2KT99_9SPHN|nr:PepSY-associated TM helix domain-containing protein [Sphingomonas liriopis]MCP3734668.1 PepSY domain-containing protein [Sphingomonas liriopis]
MSAGQWRRRWFQIHKWIGLILAILIVPLSLSGAALVWHDGLDRIVNPARYQTSGEALLAPGAYAAAAQAAVKPGERIAQIGLPEGDGPVTVAAVPPDAQPARRGPPLRDIVYLDPPTARVLDVAPGNAGLVRVLHRLHGSLLLPGVGRSIVGWIGVAMLVSSLTGLWLWWPTVGSWRKGLRWRRHRNTDTNLHHMAGFWIALPLFVLSLTGVWISFPGVFGGRDAGPQRGPDRAAMMRALPLAAPAQPVDAVLARAAAVVRGPFRSIAWPTTLSADWTVSFADGRQVKVADDGGVAVAVAARRPGGAARWMRRIHDGEGMGGVWQLVIFAGGILPAVLAVTGIIMWWRARGWRAKVQAKRGA